MADIPAVAVAEPRTPNRSNNPPTRGGGPRTAVEFRKSVFFQRESDGGGVNRNLQRDGSLTPEQERESEFVKLDERIKGRYTNFLNNHVAALARLSREAYTGPPPIGMPNYRNMLDAITADPRHRNDLEVLNKLAIEQVDELGKGTKVYEVIPGKIENFLKDPKGWIITTQLLEEQIAREMFSIGLTGRMNPSADPEMLAENRVVSLNVDRGALRGFIEDTAMPWMEERVNQTAGRRNLPGGRFAPGPLQWARNAANNFAAGMEDLRRGDYAGFVATTAGLAVSHPQVGIPALAGEATYYGFNRLMRDGLQLDLRQCAAALKSMKGPHASAVDREYVRAMTGIDVDDFQVNAAGNIELARATQRTNRDVQRELLPKLVGLMHTRNEFYRQIGASEQDLDALPEQFIYYRSRPNTQPEKLGVIWQQRLLSELDTVNPAAGNPRALHPTGMAESLHRYQEARQRVILSFFKDYIDSERSSTDRTETLGLMEESVKSNAIAAIDQKIAARGDTNGELVRRRTEVATREKGLLEGDRRTLDAERTTFDNYRTKQEQLSSARTELERELTTAFVAAYPTAADALTALRNVLRDPAANITLAGGRVINSTFARVQVENIWRDNQKAIARGAYLPIAGETPEAYDRRLRDVDATIDNDYQARIARIQPDIDEINGLIARVGQLQEGIRNAQTGLSETAEDTRELNQITRRFGEEFTTIAGWTGPGFVLDQAALATEPVDVLLQRINAANTANTANGWPESQNARADIRMRVTHAKLEAAARTAEPRINAPGADFTALTGAVHNLSENQIRVMSVAEISTRTGGALTNPQIQTAKDAAQARLDARFNALRDYQTLINEQIEQRNYEIGRVDFTGEIAQLSAAREVLRDYGDIMMASQDAVFVRDDDTNNFRFFNSQPVQAVGAPARADLTEAERAQYTIAGVNQVLPEGYLELMDVFFDYRSKENRGQVFQTAMQVLPPERLALLLDETIRQRRLAIPLPPNPDVYTILAEVNNLVDQNRVSSLDVRRAFRSIINTVREQALAMP